MKLASLLRGTWQLRAAALIFCHGLSLNISAAELERPKKGSTITQQVDFYVNKLGDKTYGEHLKESDGHEGFWQTAPEELGLIGSPALEPLIKKLETSTDGHERSMVFYALRLASQAPDLKQIPGLKLPFGANAYPPEKEHDKFKAIWLDWWANYGPAIQKVAAGRLNEVPSSK